MASQKLIIKNSKKLNYEESINDNKIQIYKYLGVILLTLQQARLYFYKILS